MNLTSKIHKGGGRPKCPRKARQSQVGLTAGPERGAQAAPPTGARALGHLRSSGKERPFGDRVMSAAQHGETVLCRCPARRDRDPGVECALGSVRFLGAPPPGRPPTPPAPQATIRGYMWLEAASDTVPLKFPGGHHCR